MSQSKAVLGISRRVVASDVRVGAEAHRGVEAGRKADVVVTELLSAIGALAAFRVVLAPVVVYYTGLDQKIEDQHFALQVQRIHLFVQIEVTVG